MSSNGKNAVITGGSCISYALLSELLRLGVSSIGLFHDIEDAPALELTRKEFKDAKIEFYQTDIRCRDDIHKSFKQFITKNQYIDILINNSGSVNENQHEDIILTNLLGLINCTYEAMDHMSTSRKGRGGLIINVSTVCGILHLPFLPVLTAAKHGVIAFTKTMANDTNTKIHGVKFFGLSTGLTLEKPLANVSGLFTQDFTEQGVQHFSTMCKQTPLQLGECFRKIFPIAENGSVWIITNGKFKEYVPEYFDPEGFVKS